jgi:osmotically-inducible protein OsmY
MIPESRSRLPPRFPSGWPLGLHLASSLGLASVLCGCSPIGMAVGAGATVVNMAMEERGIIHAVNDDAIWLGINNRLYAHDKKLFENVSLQVHEGRVLLSGYVQKPEDRVEALKIAWQSDGVREVNNQMKIGPSLSLADYAEDAYLIQRLRLVYFIDEGIRANNFSVDCIRSTVYLVGVAQNEAELQRAIDHARDIPYVRNVVTDVRLKSEPLSPIPDHPPEINLPTEEEPPSDMPVVATPTPADSGQPAQAAAQ